MAAINFPSSPSIGDTHTEAGVTWEWDSVSWNTLSAGGVATTPQFLADASGLLLATDPVWAAAGFVALTDAATIAVDLATFVNAGVTLAGNRTLGTPSNLKEGQAGTIAIAQDATGGRTLAFASGWVFDLGVPPAPSVAAGSRTLLSYQVLESGDVFIGYAGRNVGA